ncbi:hypothetical protein DUI87_07996 [Hirundo rustica rustica]|uniref:Uncharacterized protein n=1 Tax=Hirundo rustica rustica TaxID=333673 RepID=A0A3M0KR76_HIRRU|nr:hypothetical protein DUI87_07996 [Hirundo rustica rustica]
MRGGGGTNRFTLVTKDRTPGNGMKLNQGRFGLDVRKKFFTQRVALGIGRFPQETGELPEEALSQLRDGIQHLHRVMENGRSAPVQE